MTTPSQWNGQQSPEPQQNAPHQGAAAGTEQGAPGYGTPPTGQPTAYNGYGQAPQGQGYGQTHDGASYPAGHEYPAAAQQPQPAGYQQPAGNGYQQPAAYPQATPSTPRQTLTFATLRDELSFVKNRFGMISLVSALGGWLLTTLLGFVMNIVARTGSFRVYEVLNPTNTILQILTAAAAVVFGLLALRASGWRNMPASVGAVLGLVMIIPALFYFLFSFVPFSY